MPEHSNHHAATPEQLLEIYLDGLLDGDELARFERLMSERADLRATVEQQRRIDESLRRQWMPPAAAELARPVPRIAGGDESARPASIRRPWWRKLGVAAALAGGVVGAWLIWDTVRPGPPITPGYPDPGPWRDVETVYQLEVAGGLTPDWVCETDEEFIATFRDLLGQGLRLGALPADVQAVGLSYVNTLTPRTVVLLARAQDEPVLVFVDRADRGRTPALAPNSPLRLHERRLDGLILYELGPWEESRILGSFSLPEEGQ